jgi:hypothetical protein
MRPRFRAAALRPTRSAVAVGTVAVVLVVLLVVLVAGGSGGGRPASSRSLAIPPANAVLSVQLDYLDRLIAQARR